LRVARAPLLAPPVCGLVLNRGALVLLLPLLLLDKS
jgi:hypothetical protein